jgi:hypothetical protein
MLRFDNEQHFVVILNDEAAHENDRRLQTESSL